MDSVDFFTFCEDLASLIPREDLRLLMSMVEQEFFFAEQHNSKMITLMDSFRRPDNIKTNLKLKLDYLNLNKEETMALVRIMTNQITVLTIDKKIPCDPHVSHVCEPYEVDVEDSNPVNVDIETLTQYDGKGKCKMVKIYADTADIYKQDILRWAQRINWIIDYSNNQVHIFSNYEIIIHEPGYEEQFTPSTKNKIKKWHSCFEERK